LLWIPWLGEGYQTPLLVPFPYPTPRRSTAVSPQCSARVNAYVALHSSARCAFQDTRGIRITLTIRTTSFEGTRTNGGKVWFLLQPRWNQRKNSDARWDWCEDIWKVSENIYETNVFIQVMDTAVAQLKDRFT
jgi:hypothetical protein